MEANLILFYETRPLLYKLLAKDIVIHQKNKTSTTEELSAACEVYLL